MSQQILDPKLYPLAGDPPRAKPLPLKGSSIPLDALSKDCKKIFADFDRYLKALGHEPAELHVFREQAVKIEKGLRRLDDRLRVDHFTYKGIPLRIFDNK